MIAYLDQLALSTTVLVGMALGLVELWLRYNLWYNRSPSGGQVFLLD